ncbi:hypothetical protein T492DRAFT_833528 [Pavlovales sp. CCMP2436]|nr:hypothetical protein T492DRAFT_833528 [Pavlovales sp. CCMP2436]
MVLLVRLGRARARGARSQSFGPEGGGKPECEYEDHRDGRQAHERCKFEVHDRSAAVEYSIDAALSEQQFLVRPKDGERPAGYRAGRGDEPAPAGLSEEFWLNRAESSEEREIDDEDDCRADRGGGRGAVRRESGHDTAGKQNVQCIYTVGACAGLLRPEQGEGVDVRREGTLRLEKGGKGGGGRGGCWDGKEARRERGGVRVSGQVREGRARAGLCLGAMAARGGEQWRLVWVRAGRLGGGRHTLTSPTVIVPSTTSWGEGSAAGSTGSLAAETAVLAMKKLTSSVSCGTSSTTDPGRAMRQTSASGGSSYPSKKSKIE